ncbi:hypothetical protein LCGC14_0224880 [marine sediment metagenome]|uniref:Bacteriophage T5 Orf172 DNA-binding domain-containing protein n=1 Tax=marine sediment metagenome TaxID=412755 RepID=A0A0F9UGX4_9ZZZZ
MTVYFIKEKGTKYFKIGYTEQWDIDKRISSIQTGNPRRLELMFEIPNADRIIETILTYILIDYKVRGEWFKISIKKVRKIILKKWDKAIEDVVWQGNLNHILSDKNRLLEILVK